MSGRVGLCVLVVLAAVTAASAASASTPKHAAPVYDCTKLLPASEFAALTGAGPFTLSGVVRSTSSLTTNCHYGANLVVIDAGPTGLATYNHWVAGATASSQKYQCSSTVIDTRDCSLSALPGYGLNTTAYRRSIISLTRDNAFVQVRSEDKSLSYEQLEPVVKYLLGRLK